MRILHIFDHSLPLHSGYTFRSRSILLEQRRRGWETVHLTTPRHIMRGPNQEQVEDLVFYRTPVRNGISSKLPVVREIAEILATAKRLGALVEKTKPDILHAHSPILTALAADLVARRNGLPLIYEIRAFWEDAAASQGTYLEGGLRYKATHFLETFVARRADAVACICQGLMDDLIQRGIDRNKLFLVPNAVDIEQFAESTPRDLALASKLHLSDAEVIGFIGSYYDYEGLDILLASMPELLARRPRLRLLLVGGGPCEVALKKQARSLGVEGQVYFAGRIPHDEIARYYSLIDVLVYPRKRMRLTELVTPLKPLEAMAGGKLVAASDVGGHRELIEAGVTGELFAADNPSALAESVNQLLCNPEIWADRRKKARLYVSEERTWAKTVSLYEPIYSRLLSGRRS